MANDNPRYPHSVKILRVIGEDERGDEIKEPIYESECGLRDLVRGKDVDANVIKSDYKLAMPYKNGTEGHFAPDIRIKDLIEFTHSYTGQVIKGEVEDFKAWNPMFGMNIWFESNKNKYGG